jgi:hypothetical protein
MTITNPVTAAKTAIFRSTHFYDTTERCSKSAMATPAWATARSTSPRWRTSLTGVFQFVLHKDMYLKWPLAETPTHWISMGIDQDLTEAAKICVRGDHRFPGQQEKDDA